jgi:MFS transporter, DHA2 family, methylenomycin A resistance protein
VWAMVGGVAGGCGPLLGGILAGTLGWRWLFAVNIPVGIVGLFMVWRFVDVGRGPAESARERSFDYVGQLAAVVSLVALTAALVQAGQAGLTSVGTLVLLGVFVVGAVAFVAAERRGNSPMLPLPLFRSRAVSSATVVGLLMNLGFYGQLFVLTLYLQEVRHYSPLLTGVALLPQTGVIALASWLGGQLTSRRGPRLPMLIGLSVGAVGFFALTIVHQNIAYWALVVPIALAGFGISFTMPAATAAVVEGVPADRNGVASGTLNASRQVGGAIGIALLGSFAHGGGEQFVSGFRLALIIAGAVYVVGALVATATPPKVDDSERERIAQLVG